MPRGFSTELPPGVGWCVLPLVQPKLCPQIEWYSTYMNHEAYLYTKHHPTNYSSNPSTHDAEIPASLWIRNSSVKALRRGGSRSQGCRAVKQWRLVPNADIQRFGDCTSRGLMAQNVAQRCADLCQQYLSGAGQCFSQHWCYTAGSV